MKAVIYARYSSDNQREESIEGQIRECTAFAERNDIQIVDTYIDRALSAKTDKRPEFKKMIKDSEKENFELIIVWKTDRFARNREDSAIYKAILKRHKVSVISATEPKIEGPAGILLESLLEGMAEYYSVELAEKVIRGQTENALKCKSNGGTPPFGYIIDENKNFQLNPDTAPLVLEAFEMYNEGKTMKEIAEDFTRRGVKNSIGTNFTLNTISNLLSNRRYIGEYKYRDIVVPHGIPAIVSEELFENTQAKLKSNKKAPARNKAVDDYILSTKLYCGKCMSFMVGESGTSRNSNTYRYYKCISAKRKRGCDKKAVKKDWIEDIVINEIKKILFDDELISNLADMIIDLLNEENTVVPLLENQLKEIEKKISNLLRAIEAGIFTDSTKNRLNELEDEKKEIEIKIAKENIAKPVLTKDKIIFWFNRLKKIDTTKPKQRRQLVDMFVNSIILYDDRIEFYFNFKNGAKSISTSDLNKSSDLLKPPPP